MCSKLYFEVLKWSCALIPLQKQRGNDQCSNLWLVIFDGRVMQLGFLLLGLSLFFWPPTIRPSQEAVSRFNLPACLKTSASLTSTLPTSIKPVCVRFKISHSPWPVEFSIKTNGSQTFSHEFLLSILIDPVLSLSCSTMQQSSYSPWMILFLRETHSTMWWSMWLKILYVYMYSATYHKGFDFKCMYTSHHKSMCIYARYTKVIFPSQQYIR